MLAGHGWSASTGIEAQTNSGVDSQHSSLDGVFVELCHVRIFIHGCLPDEATIILVVNLFDIDAKLQSCSPALTGNDGIIQ